MWTYVHQLPEQPIWGSAFIMVGFFYDSQYICVPFKNSFWPNCPSSRHKSYIFSMRMLITFLHFFWDTYPRYGENNLFTCLLAKWRIKYRFSKYIYSPHANIKERISCFLLVYKILSLFPIKTDILYRINLIIIEPNLS